MQMAPYVSITTTSGDATAILNWLASVARLQFPSSKSSFGLCAVASLSATDKVRMEALIPFALGAAMLLLHVIASLWSRWAVRDQSTACGSCRAACRRVHGLSHPSTGDDSAYLLMDTDNSVASNAALMPARARACAAVVNWLLFTYSSFSAAVVALLHCVSLPDEHATSALFIQARHTCDYGGWQLKYVLALLALISFGLSLPFVARASVSITAYSERSCVSDALIGARRTLVEVYSPSFYWWEFVLLLQRLSLTLLFIFSAGSPIMQSVGSSVVCILGLTLHLLCQPFSDRSARRLQTILLLCLCLVSLCKVSAATRLQLASPVVLAAVNSAFNALTVVLAFLVPVLAFFASCFRCSGTVGAHRGGKAHTRSSFVVES